MTCKFFQVIIHCFKTKWIKFVNLLIMQFSMHSKPQLTFQLTCHFTQRNINWIIVQYIFIVRLIWNSFQPKRNNKLKGNEWTASGKHSYWASLNKGGQQSSEEADETERNREMAKTCIFYSKRCTAPCRCCKSWGQNNNSILSCWLHPFCVVPCSMKWRYVTYTYKNTDILNKWIPFSKQCGLFNVYWRQTFDNATCIQFPSETYKQDQVEGISTVNEVNIYSAIFWIIYKYLHLH